LNQQLKGRFSYIYTKSHDMKTIILLFTILISQLAISQFSDPTANFFIDGNVNLYKLKEYDTKIKGSPYLDKSFKTGEIIFENGKKYSAQIRLNVSEQKFEIKNNQNNQASAIDIDETVTVIIEGEIYKLFSFKLNKPENTIAVLEEILKLESYGLYYFPQKKIEMPTKPNVAAPTTGYTKPPSPKWVDNSVFLIFNNNKSYIVPTSHKKMQALNLIDGKAYKKYRKANKLNLKNKESLKSFVTYLNSTQL
jgi:hypothetical protein